MLEAQAGFNLGRRAVPIAQFEHRAPREAPRRERHAAVGPRPLDDTDRRILAEVSARTGAIRDTPGDPRLQVPRPLRSSEAE